MLCCHMLSSWGPCHSEALVIPRPLSFRALARNLRRSLAIAGMTKGPRDDKRPRDDNANAAQENIKNKKRKQPMQPRLDLESKATLSQQDEEFLSKIKKLISENKTGRNTTKCLRSCKQRIYSNLTIFA